MYMWGSFEAGTLALLGIYIALGRHKWGLGPWVRQGVGHPLL